MRVRSSAFRVSGVSATYSATHSRIASAMATSSSAIVSLRQAGILCLGDEFGQGFAELLGGSWRVLQRCDLDRLANRGLRQSVACYLGVTFSAVLPPTDPLSP